MTEETVSDALARITREAFAESLYHSATRPSLFKIDKAGRLMLRRDPWLKRVLRGVRRRARNAWWALHDRVPDEETYSEWWL